MKAGDVLTGIGVIGLVWWGLNWVNSPSATPSVAKAAAKLPSEQTAAVGSKVTLAHSYMACQSWDTYTDITAAQVRDKELSKHKLMEAMYSGDCIVAAKGTEMVITEQHVTSLRWRKADDKQFRQYWISKGTFADD